MQQPPDTQDAVIAASFDQLIRRLDTLDNTGLTRLTAAALGLIATRQRRTVPDLLAQMAADARYRAGAGALN